MDKKSFVLYTDMHGFIKAMTDEQAGELMKLVYSYACDGMEGVSDDTMVAATFGYIKIKLDDCDEKYKEKRRKASENAKKRWHATAMQKDATACDRIKPQCEPMLSVSDSVSVSVSDTVNNNTNVLQKDVVDWWNDLADTYSIPKLKKITTQRKKSLNARISEAGGLQAFQDQIKTAISNSDHLVGKNDREWKADFDWLIKPDNYIKVIEGKYNRKGSSGHAITRYGDTQQLFIHHIQDDFKAVAKQLQGANAKDFLVQFYVDAKNSGIKLNHEGWLTKIKERGQTYAK